jgi:hypothetical protein
VGEVEAQGVGTVLREEFAGLGDLGLGTRVAVRLFVALPVHVTAEGTRIAILIQAEKATDTRAMDTGPAGGRAP